MATQNKIFDVEKLKKLMDQLKGLKDQAQKLENGFFVVDGLVFNDEIIIINYELIKKMRDAGYTSISLSILQTSRPGKRSTVFLAMPTQRRVEKEKERITL